MPYVRPTVGELVENSRNDIESRLDGADTRARPNNLDIDAKVWAGGLDGVYDAVATASRRSFPQGCTGPNDDDALDLHAERIGLRRKLAQAASGQGLIAAPANGIFPAGKLLQRKDGAQFVTAADAGASEGAATLQIVATVAGKSGDTPTGTQLTVVNPEDGFARTVVVIGDDGLDGGLDRETNPELLARIKEKWAEQPQGGAFWDFVQWALEVPGVTRAWGHKRWMGIGTTGLSFVMDDQAGTILPDADSVALVQAYLDDPHRAPPYGEMYVFAPTFAVCNFTIQCPAIDAVRTAITASLDAMFFQDQSPGGAFLLPDGTKPAGVIELERMWSTIEAASSGEDVLLISPVADFVAGLGQLPKRGAITWTLPE